MKNRFLIVVSAALLLIFAVLIVIASSKLRPRIVEDGDYQLIRRPPASGSSADTPNLIESFQEQGFDVEIRDSADSQPELSPELEELQEKIKKGELNDTRFRPAGSPDWEPLEVNDQ